MAGEVADADRAAQATQRRADFAIEAIREIVRQKAGNRSVHGSFTVKLDWKAGTIELVTVENSTTYK